MKQFVRTDTQNRAIGGCHSKEPPMGARFFDPCIDLWGVLLHASHKLSCHKDQRRCDESAHEKSVEFAGIAIGVGF
jgi:hypothetical protein